MNYPDFRREGSTLNYGNAEGRHDSHILIVMSLGMHLATYAWWSVHRKVGVEQVD